MFLSIKRIVIFSFLIFAAALQLTAAPSINDDPETPRMLVAAAERNYVDVIDALLSRGADINLQNINGYSAVSTASENGNAALTKYLLSRGAKKSDVKPAHHSPFVMPDIKDDYQAPEIYIFGIRYGIKEIVTSMLARGIPIDTNDALGTAVSVNNVELTSMLISKGADLNSVNGSNLSLIENAITNDGIDCGLLLHQKGVKLNNTEPDWYVKQLYAFITKKDKNTEAKDPDTEMNLLMTAASKNHVNTVRFLIKNGANINSVFKSSQMSHRPLNGSTALIFALRDGSGSDAAMELIKLKASLDNLNNTDESALLIAVYHADLKMVTALLDAGANVNRGDSFGHTPLYNAIMNNDKDMIKLLKSRGGK